MEFKIKNETVEFELSRNTKNQDVLLGINIKEIVDDKDVLTISILLTEEEFNELKTLIGGER
jgi:dynactin complex subunit